MDIIVNNFSIIFDIILNIKCKRELMGISKMHLQKKVLE
jgi:hypothetical protein